MKKRPFPQRYISWSLIIALLAIGSAELHATAYYWDLNQGAAGVGGATPSGNWDGTTQNWNTSSTGGSGTYVATPGTGNDGTLTANSESSGSYTITLTGTQYAKSLTAKYGNPTVSGGTLALDNNVVSGGTYLVAGTGANLTLDSTCTLLVNNASTVTPWNFLNLNPAISQTITINGAVTATVNNSANKIFIRSTGTGTSIINTDLGTDASFKTGLQAGGFDGAAGTLTLKGPQTLGTTPYINSARLGTFNFGDTVNTSVAVSLGSITLQKTTADLTGATINMNSAVSLGSANILLSSGGALNVGGSLTTSGSTTLGSTSDGTKHGGSIKISSGGSATLGAINVLDTGVFTDAGTLSAGTLTLGSTTGNTVGSLVLGDGSAAGTATLTGLAVSGSGANTIVGGNSANSTLTLNNSGTVTLGTGLTFGGAGANQNNLILDKTGAGTLSMGNGGNTYSGGTIFENGIIQLGASSALGTGPLTVGTANSSGFVKLQLSGYNQTVSGLANGSVGTIIIEANAITGGATSLLTVNQANNTTSTYSGVLRDTAPGVLALTKSGNGTLALSGANIYSGNTTVSAGTLTLTGGSLKNTAITVNGGTFAVQPGSATTIAAGVNTISGAGASLNLGANTFDMTDGAISIFNLQQEGTFSGAALTIANGATLKFNLGNSSADKMVVSTTASVSGTVNVTLDTTLMTAPVTGTYSLITAASGLTTGSPTWQFTGGGTTKTVTVNGSVYTLTLLSTGSAVSVKVEANTASQLVFTTQPSASTVAGVAFAPQPVVKIEDQYGNVVTSGSDATKSVALTLTTGAGTLGGTVSMNAVAGVADFSGKGLNINLVGADKVLTATATVTAGVKTVTTSPAFAITPAAASTLTVSGFPSSATAGTTGTVTVTAKDAFGNTASGYTGTIHFTSSDAQAVLPSNYAFVSGDNGAKNFTSGVTLKTAGTQTITATDTVTGSITGIQSSIAITASSAANIALTSGNSQSAAVTANLANPLVVTVTDTYGNPVSGTNVNFSFGTLPSGTTGQALGTAVATTSVSGQASTTVTLGTKAGSYPVTATATGLTGSPVNFTTTATAVTPSAPTITGITAGNTTLSVAFTAPGSDGGATITDYKYSTDNGSSFTSAGTISSPILISGLANGTPYQVQIKAVNAAGDGTATVSTSGTPVSPQVATTVNLSCNMASPSIYGQTLIFTAAVQTNGVTAGDATSNVVFSVGATPVWTNALVSGVAYYTNDDLTAGTTNIVAAYAGDANYLASSITNSQQVNPANPTLTISAGGITYGQTLLNSTLSVLATNLFDADADGDEQVSGTYGYVDATIAPNAGATNVAVYFHPTDTTNYVAVTNTVSVTVGKASATVVLGNLSQTYNGTAKSVTSSTTPSGLTVTVTYAGSPDAPTNANTYQVIGTVVDNNYAGSATNNLVIGMAASSVTLSSGTSFTYDGSAKTPTFTFGGSGGAQTYSYTGTSYGPTANAPTNAGSYFVDAVVATDANYNGATNTTSFTITKASATVALGNLSQAYDGMAKSVTSSTTPSGLTVTLTYAALPNAPTNANTYQVIGTVVDNNYAGSATNNLVISPAALGITANNDSKDYGQTKTYGAGSTAFTTVGLQNSDTIGSVTITATSSPTNGTVATDNVGSYDLTPSFATGGTFNPANYNISYTNGTLSVVQANTFVGAISTKNPSGYKDAVSFQATLPIDATGNVVFSSTNGFISTNALSGGSATSLSITNLLRGTNLITVTYVGDGNYLGSTTNLEQIVTNHPPVAVDATYYRAKGLSLKIAITNLLTYVTDMDGDTIALSSVGIGLTNATILTNDTYVFYLPTTGAGSNDNDVVSYTVSDGFGSTATANILINVYSASGPAQMSIPTNGVVNIKFFGIPNYTYVVQTTTNLSVPWWTLSTNTAGTNGSWLFTDPNATNTQQYYRSSQP